MHDKVNFGKSVLIIRLLCLDNFEAKSYEKLTVKINNLVNDLIKESFVFSSRERLRKNIIECLYYEKDEKKEEKKDDIVENDDLNTSHENLNAKLGTKVKYKKEKIFYTYFLGDKQINKMKKYIVNILSEKINDKKIYDKLFQFLFDKKYYLTNITSQKGSDNHYKVEKMFYS